MKVHKRWQTLGKKKNGRSHLRLRGVQKALDGYMLYTISAPTYALKDLLGEQMLKEAEKLVVMKFGRMVWENEMRRLG